MITEQTPVETPLDDFFANLEREAQAGGGDFEDIDKGQYILELTSAKDFRRDKNGVLRADLEFTITGWGKDTGERFDGRKLWDFSALEGDQFNYLVAGMIAAFATRNPDKRVALKAIPYYKQAVPDEGIVDWENYLAACGGLDFIANVRPYKDTWEGVERTKYRINVAKDQTL